MSGEPLPRCILAGYFGYGNAGDELIHKILRQQITSVRWSILWPPDVPPPEGMETFNRWDWVSLTRAFRRSKALVLGGGELFQARTSFLSLLYYVALVFWASSCGCEVWAFGLGVDPELSLFERWLVRRALSRARGLWVRDQKTSQILEGAVPEGKINFAPDPVWAWQPELDAAPPPAELRRVLWVLRSADDLDDSEEWAAELNKLSERLPVENGFLCLQPSLDSDWLSSLQSRLKFFHRQETWAELEDLPKIFRRYDLIVTMRFHGIVLSDLSVRCGVAVAGHGKVSQLAADQGWPVLTAEEANVSTLERSIRTAWERWKTRPNNSYGSLGDEARDALTALNSRIGASSVHADLPPAESPNIW